MIINQSKKKLMKYQSKLLIISQSIKKEDNKISVENVDNQSLN